MSSIDYSKSELNNLFGHDLISEIISNSVNRKLKENDKILEISKLLRKLRRRKITMTKLATDKRSQKLDIVLGNKNTVTELTDEGISFNYLPDSQLLRISTSTKNLYWYLP